METLTEVADAADAMARQARRSLVSAVRSAANDGMSQAEIAHAIGRSQPEVSRLLHFHGTSPLARRLRKARLFGDEWRALWGLRNRIAHGYLLDDARIVAATVERGVCRDSADNADDGAAPFRQLGSCR